MKSLLLSLCAALVLVAVLSAMPTRSEAAMIEVTSANVQQEVLESKIPVFVDFWAVWCGPCREMEPTVERLSKEYAGKVKFVRIDIDRSPELLTFSESIPAMVLYSSKCGAKCPKTQEQDYDALKSWIHKSLVWINKQKAKP